MRRLLIVLALAVLASGCAVRNTHFGNFTQPVSMAFDQQVAADAVEKLHALYPPARTQFDLLQPANDVFGRALIRGLREQGFAVREFNSQAPNVHQEVVKEADEKLKPTYIPNVALGYVLDRNGTENFYRLTLSVGGQKLGRAYAITAEGDARPIGYWTRETFGYQSQEQ